MKLFALFTAILLTPTLALACSADEISKLTAALKISADNLNSQDIAGAGEESWKILTKKDGNISSITHTHLYDVKRESNKLAVVDTMHFAIKKEIYNYVESKDSASVADTAHKDIQTYFYCNGAPYLAGGDKQAYAQAANTLRAEFFDATVLKDILVKANLRGAEK